MGMKFDKIWVVWCKCDEKGAWTDTYWIKADAVKSRKEYKTCGTCRTKLKLIKFVREAK